jgi:hypothetical protein
VEVLRIADPRARLEALKTGRVDAVNLADPAWAAEARRHGRIALTAVPGAAFLELAVEGAEDGRGRGARAPRARPEAACPRLRRAGARGGVARGGREGTVAVGSRPSACRGPRRCGGRSRGGAGGRAAGRGGRAAVDRGAAAARAAHAGLAGDSAREAAAAPLYRDDLIAHATRLHHGQRIGGLWDMDSARIAERWWYS